MAELLKVKIRDEHGITRLYYVNGDVWKEKLEASRSDPKLAKQVLEDIQKSAANSRNDAIYYSVDG